VLRRDEPRCLRCLLSRQESRSRSIVDGTSRHDVESFGEAELDEVEGRVGGDLS